MSGKLKYFISYCYDDDLPDTDGVSRITNFSNHLKAEVTKRGIQELDFTQYYSRDDHTWSGDIGAKLRGELETSHFLVPILSPSYLNPDRKPENWCLFELKHFLSKHPKERVFPIRLEDVNSELLGKRHRYRDLFTKDGNLDIRLTSGPLYQRTVVSLSKTIRDDWNELIGRRGPSPARSNRNEPPPILESVNAFPLKLSEKTFLVDGDSQDEPLVRKVANAIKGRGAGYVGFVAKHSSQSRYRTAAEEWRNSVGDSHVVVLVREKGEPSYTETRAIYAAQHILAGDAQADVSPGKSGRIVVMLDAAKDDYQPSAIVREFSHIIKPIRVKHKDPGACAREVVKAATS